VKLRVLCATVFSLLFTAACGYSDPYGNSGPVANESPPHGSPTPGVDDFHAGDGLPRITYPDGLQYVTLKVGTGQIAKLGDIVTMQYTGWLQDGTVFDSSRQPGRTAFSAYLAPDPSNCPSIPNVSCVIAGWNEGVPGMAVGGIRKLIIPPELAYGAQGQQDPQTGAYLIPPEATLVFEVELISVKAGPKPSPTPTPKASPSPTPSPSK
jgi:FKBP-type peptidyl-prolyl cis-trans isomerase FkpA